MMSEAVKILSLCCTKGLWNVVWTCSSFFKKKYERRKDKLSWKYASFLLGYVPIYTFFYKRVTVAWQAVSVTEQSGKTRSAIYKYSTCSIVHTEHTAYHLGQGLCWLPYFFIEKINLLECLCFFFRDLNKFKYK